MNSETSTGSFWWPVVVSLVVTPVVLLLGFASAGAGHGDYFWVKLLLPYAMLAMISGFGLLSIPLALAQCPMYGILLGRANQESRMFAVARGLMISHGMATTISFLMAV